MFFYAKDDTIINNKRGLNMLYKYNKESNLVTISNSILKHFTGIKLNKTCRELDTILEKKEYKKIVVMLFDGLGASIREKHLSENDFLRKFAIFELFFVDPTPCFAKGAGVWGLRRPKGFFVLF